MLQWEYKKIQANRVHDWELNELGAKGWELVTVIHSTVFIYLYFKRPLVSNEN